MVGHQAVEGVYKGSRQQAEESVMSVAREGIEIECMVPDID